MNFLLKQRLVGAIVLVALGVIFIPMLLEGPEQLQMPEMQPMPEQKDLPSGGQLHGFPKTDKVLPLPPMSVMPEKTPEPIETKPAPVSKSASQVKRKSEPVVKPKPKPKTKPIVKKPTAKLETAAKPELLRGWVIQVGSFANQKNAFGLRDRLRKGGYVTQVERVVLEKGETYRVRIGPYLERDKADDKLDDLRKKYQVNPRVMAYP